MQLVDQTDAGGPLIRHVANDAIAVGAREWRESFLIQPGTEIVSWSVPALSAFGAPQARSLLARNPALVILGCGAKQAFPPAEFAAQLLRAGVGLETMPNAAAARTFNLLVGEGRNVLGAFLLP
ncbi:MAG: MTH938/NDUFAF3 family protein [Lysobacterales bacterium]